MKATQHATAPKQVPVWPGDLVLVAADRLDLVETLLRDAVAGLADSKAELARARKMARTAELTRAKAKAKAKAKTRHAMPGSEAMSRLVADVTRMTQESIGAYAEGTKAHVAQLEKMVALDTRKVAALRVQARDLRAAVRARAAWEARQGKKARRAD